MSYPIQPLKLGALFDTTFQLIEKNFWAMFWINGVVLLPFYFIFVLTLAWGMEYIQSNRYWFVEMPSWIPVLFLLVLALFFMVVYLTEAAVVKAFGKIYLGQPVLFGECYRSILPKFPALLWSVSIASFFVLIGYVFLVIPGLILQLMFFVLMPILVLEPLVGMESLKRSRELMKGEYLKALLFLSAITAVSWVADFGLKFVPSPFIQILAGAAFHLLLIIFANVGTAVFYFQARAGKEGFNSEMLSQLL